MTGRKTVAKPARTAIGSKTKRTRTSPPAKAQDMAKELLKKIEANKKK